MKKIIKVELVRHTSATVDTPRVYTSTVWEIPYDSTEIQAKTSPLEEHMSQTLNAELPADFRAAAAHLVYDSLSSGGTLQIGEQKLTVEFRNAIG